MTSFSQSYGGRAMSHARILFKCVFDFHLYCHERPSMKAKIFLLFLLLLASSSFLTAQSAIVGHWEGAINIQGQELLIKVDFKASADTLVATMDIPPQNAKNLSLKNVRFQVPRAHFELPAGPGLATFDGELKDNIIAGTFTQAGIVGSFTIQRVDFSKPHVVEEVPPKYKPIVGVWNGAIDIMSTSLRMSVTFKIKGGELKAFMDIPQQHATGLALKTVSFESPKVHFELAAGPGLAVFDGEMKGDSLKGLFMQSGMAGSFYLGRGEAKAAQAPVEEIVPYKKEEVIFMNDSIKLAGTLTIPPTKGPHPAVIMITGSGPQNRDEELFGFKPFKIIADHFTRKGIAVLRYDDRGVGGSTGSTMESTSADFASDVLAAVRYLKARSDIDGRYIGLCGHSEGGIVAPLAASQSKDIAFIICIAGTGVNGQEIILAQSELIMRADTTAEDKIKKALEMTRKSFAVAKADEGWDDLAQSLRENAERDLKTMPEEQKKAVKNEEEYLKAMVDAQMKSLRTPWFKFFLTYEPAPILEKVACPVLLLFGELDLQVPAELNRKTMEAALKKGKNKNYTVKVFPKTNHLFLTATTGSPKEYAGAKKEFVPGFLDTMSDWILKVSSSVR